MKLKFLGTSGYHPNASRQTSCLMLPELGILIDAGTGMFRAREHLTTSELHIFLSHAHLDHSIGLTYIFDIIYGKQVGQISVYGEAPKLEAIQQHLLSPLLFPVKPPFLFRALTSKTIGVGGGSMTWFPLDHPGGSIGFRYEREGKSFAYVTDTTAQPSAKYIEAIRGVDLLIHECNFRDGFEEQAALTGHSTTSQVAQVALASEAKRLVLMHLNPLDENSDPVGLDKIREVVRNSEIAFDEMEVEI